MKAERALASLSLDLDNQWSYMKTHGDAGWERFPSYLDVVVPRALEMLDRKDLTITFMIVGQDAALPQNAAALRRIGISRHEVGNHSFHHEQWMHLRPETEIEAELGLAEQHIEKATGRRPEGFRGPGYVLSPAVLRVLARRGYLYDGSTFPTYLGPLARAYYFMTSRMSAEERAKRKDLFGSWRDGRQPLKPYVWEVGDGRVLEIPVTTLPGLKVPFHVSYALYLSVVSPALGTAYFSSALRLCRLAGVAPSVLLHPLDFLGKEDVPELAFFPAMGLPAARKLAFVERLLGMLVAAHRVVPLGVHAREALDRGDLPGRSALDGR
jgi:peptidoglycan-N-acetylglucosamine deacetylase